MSALTQAIVTAIGREGPMSLERFWNIALFDPAHGYYTSRMPLGADGDFTTAPEISQMFGELIGAWLVAAWQGLGRPAPFLLAEFGPGRGTLMADILRTARQIDIAFVKAARIRLIETSDRLAAEQQATLARFDLPVRRARRLDELEHLPLLLVANELFDAVATRQFRFDGSNWRERCVGLDAHGALAFVDGPVVANLPLPGGALPAPGTLFELAPLREAIAAAIGQRIAVDGGAALLIDYGHARSAFGDTLQALSRHRFAPVLEAPGRQDITSHVDFERLGLAMASGGGAQVSEVMEQGSFLLSLGLRERAMALAGNGSAQEAGAVEAAARRLAGRQANEMGALFKVLAAARIRLQLPPFGAPEQLD